MGEHLEGALDRFAAFFISPLFTPSCTSRELNAVDSENSQNLQSDGWRAMQVSKAVSSEAHPFHQFATGNAQTLRSDPAEQGVDIRSELLAFHARYYSAHRMKLCVLGK